MNQIEKQYVHDAYQTIAKDFSVTRAYLWQGVKTFVESLEPYSTIVEIGSGNGKNLYRSDCFNIASDLCSEFSKITNDKNIESLVANALQIPLKDQCADAVLCVAMLHHITDSDRRMYAIKEMARILKPGQKLFIQVWAMEQDKDAKRRFTTNDNLVPFKGRTSTTVSRFYHIFEDGELVSLLEAIGLFIIEQSYWEKGNWVAIARRCKKII